MSDTIPRPAMSAEELRRELIHVQRYEYSHRDPDSQWEIPTRVSLDKAKKP